MARNASSLVIDSLCDQRMEDDLAVAYFYCDCYSQKEQMTAADMMGAILKQLLPLREIPDDIRKAYRKGRRPRLRDQMRVLKTVIALLPEVFICIDGLDEYLRKDIFEILDSLRDIVREFPQTRIFLTGRPYLRGDIQRYFTMVVVIPISPNADETRNYLHMRLDMDYESEAMNHDLRADIVRVIMDKISDMCVGALVLLAL